MITLKIFLRELQIYSDPHFKAAIMTVNWKYIGRNGREKAFRNTETHLKVISVHLRSVLQWNLALISTKNLIWAERDQFVTVFIACGPKNRPHFPQSCRNPKISRESLAPRLIHTRFQGIWKILILKEDSSDFRLGGERMRSPPVSQVSEEDL